MINRLTNSLLSKNKYFCSNFFFIQPPLRSRTGLSLQENLMNNQSRNSLIKTTTILTICTTLKALKSWDSTMPKIILSITLSLMSLIQFTITYEFYYGSGCVLNITTPCFSAPSSMPSNQSGQLPILIKKVLFPPNSEDNTLWGDMPLDNKGKFKLIQMYRLQTLCCSLPC